MSGERRTDAGNVRKAMFHIFLYFAFSCIAIFAPRSSWHWIEGWTFIFLFTAFLVSAFVPLAENPYLLEARVSSPFRKRQAPMDKAIFCILSGLHFLWILAIGLDAPVLGDHHRFGFAWVSLGGIVFLLSIAAISAIVSGNPYLIPAVEHQENQRIVEKGLYSRVRHPMYATIIAMSFGGSLLTSSLLGLGVSVLILGAFWWRILLEERFLLMKFPEYGIYSRKVKYRLFPMII
jgi:protein-S-isoprenylcysteine O-methyltransferase Ste14